LQGRSLQPLDFALGAAMATSRTCLKEIGGFRALADCIADDYQLGHRIAHRDHRIELCPVVTECWSPPMDWRDVWRHQLRWARTIRVCKPLPYFLSILSNATLWPLLWLLACATASRTTENEISMAIAIITTAVFLLFRGLIALDLERRLTQQRFSLRLLGFASLKDVLHAALWAAAFLGNTVEWRGDFYRLRPDGTLTKT
jgi:ceramide glucosyltransferase